MRRRHVPDDAHDDVHLEAVSAILFDHIAIAVWRMADAPPVLVGALGGVPVFGSSEKGFNFGHWRFAGGARIEIIEPAGANGFLHRFLAQRGPGIHHVTFKVPDIREACARAEAHGYDIVGLDDSEPHWKTAFLHPRQALGIVIQLAQASGPDPRAWQPPPGPPGPPPPVRLLGLRTRAQSRERAERQWRTVLGGEVIAGGREPLVFHWPGSPGWIAVEIEPTADEGPLAIEFASDRPVSLPDGPVPGLGTVFVKAPS